ncbi:MAG: hypothetical protein AB1488_07505 [Nitrospirota bacterium]
MHIPSGKKGIVFDIGNCMLKAIAYSLPLWSSSGRPNINKFYIVELKETEALRRKEEVSGIINEIISDSPRGYEITVIVSGESFSTRNISFPFSGIKRIKDTLPFELEGLIPFSMDEIVFDAIPSVHHRGIQNNRRQKIDEKSQGGSSVIAAILPRANLAEIFTLFPEDRKPCRVIPDFFALCGLSDSKEPDIYAIIDVGCSKSVIAIFSGGKPVVFRSVENRGNTVLNIVEGIRSLKVNIKKVFITGGGLYTEVSELRTLNSSLGIPVSILENRFRAERWPLTALCIGSVIGIMQNPNFNLLQDKDKKKNTAKWLRKIAIGAGILLVIGTIDLYMRYNITHERYLAMNNEVKRVFNILMPESKAVKEEAQIKALLTKEKELMKTLKGSDGYGIEPVRIIDALSRVSLKTPAVSILEITIDGEWCLFAGEYSGTGEAEGLKAIFVNEKDLSKTIITEITTGVKPAVYRFKAKVSLKMHSTFRSEASKGINN